MERYKHFQRAPWWLVFLPIIIPVVLPLGVPRVYVLVVVLVGVIVANFSNLTTAVDAVALRWHFLFGWPGGALATSEIERAEITRTSLFEGWGIHWTIWHGWLWNVGGFQAVEITKTDGCRITLGTDDPQGLFQAIERFRKGAA